MKIDPLAQTVPSEPDAGRETALSMPPQTEPVALPPPVAVRVASSPARAWMYAAAAVAGAATSIALAYLLR